MIVVVGEGALVEGVVDDDGNLAVVKQRMGFLDSVRMFLEEQVDVFSSEQDPDRRGAILDETAERLMAEA